jgi:hypothetical protein
MSTVNTDHVFESNLPMDDLPFDVELYLDDVEYARIMRRIDNGGGEPDTRVSAFNSSI